MKRFSKSGHSAVAEINITPLLDLAWVLLVIFIITTTALVQGIEVKLPQSTPNETDIETNTVTISIRKTGDVFLDDQPVKVQALEGILRNLKKAKGDKLPVVVRGDEGAQYKYVVAVLDALQRVPIEELGLATKPVAEDGT